MDNLIIKGTLNTPSINIDVKKKTFEISGVSLPENPNEFYHEVINYLDDYNETELTIICDLMYSNSSSTKTILTIFKKCVNLVSNPKIIWYYDIDDDDVKELGEDIQDAVGTLFEFKVKQ